MNPCEFAVEFAAKSCDFDPEFGNVIPVKEYVDRDYSAFYTEVTPMTPGETITVELSDEPKPPMLIVITRDKNEGALPKDCKHPVETVVLLPYIGAFFLGAFYLVCHLEDGRATVVTGSRNLWKYVLDGRIVSAAYTLYIKDDNTNYCVDLYCDDPASDKYCFAVGCTYRIWAVYEK